MGAIDAGAFDVAGHEVQAGHAKGAQVEVVTCLPRAFTRAVEVGVLDRVGEVDRIAADKIEGCVALDFLIRQAETVGSERVFA
jgi:hypothetical protein